MTPRETTPHWHWPIVNPATCSEAVGRLYSVRRLCSSEVCPMIAGNDKQTVMEFQRQPAWAQAWHLGAVIFPRRSITGRIVYGKVWRRHDGRHWRYKKFTEFRADEDN
jgi:hypothetical protein